MNSTRLGEFKQQWQAMMAGVYNSWKTPVLEGDVDWQFAVGNFHFLTAFVDQLYQRPQTFRLRTTAALRIDHDEACPALLRCLQRRPFDRIGNGRVAPDDQRATRVLDVLVGICGSPGAKALLHAPGRGRVADAGAAVDVVGAHHVADELLHEVVFLIGAACGGDAGDGIAAVFIADAEEVVGDVGVGLLPGCLLEAVGGPDEGFAEPVGVVDETEGKSSLEAGVGMIDLGVGGGLDGEDFVALGGDGLMLRTLHRYMGTGKPIYGMNRGSIGFLMNQYREANLRKRISDAKASIIHPLLIKAVNVRNDQFSAHAINEVSLLRQTSQIAKLRILVNSQERLPELVTDGILVATPAGSTAYNLSAKALFRYLAIELTSD